MQELYKARGSSKLTERTTRRQLEAQIKILGESINEKLSGVKVGYGHYNGRYILEIDDVEVGHHLNLGDFYSAVYGMNSVIQRVERIQLLREERKKHNEEYTMGEV